MELTIKIENKNIYESLVQFLRSLNITIVKEDRSTEEWEQSSSQNLARAYGENEPDYTENILREPNPGYERS